MNIDYDPAADAVSFETSAAEIEPGIVADYDADGHIVGIEVLSVTKLGLSAALNRAI